jgi:hypothetical protein
VSGPELLFRPGCISACPIEDTSISSDTCRTCRDPVGLQCSRPPPVLSTSMQALRWTIVISLQPSVTLAISGRSTTSTVSRLVRVDDAHP